MSLKDDMQKLFDKDVFAKKSNIQIDEVSKDFAKCSMKITPDHLNANNFVMGGAIYTLADFCFAVAANSSAPTVTLSSTINYVSSTKTSMLYAKTHCIKSGKSVAFFEVEITDNNGKMIAIASITGYRKS